MPVQQVDYPPHWPLDPDAHVKIDALLQKCDAADEICRRMAQAGLAAPAAEEATNASRAVLDGLRRTFFPHIP